MSQNTIISVSPFNIIVNNTTVRIRSNKILIQNKSNYIVTVFRTWSLTPGQTLELGSEENDSIINCDMEVEFATTLFDSLQPDVKRVEILQMNKVGGESAWHGTHSKSEVPNLDQKTLNELI